MSYNEAAKKTTIKYIREKQKTVTIRFKKFDYEDRILPAAIACDLPVATFIKQCIAEKIERDNLLGE